MASRSITRRAALGGLTVAAGAALDAVAVEPNWLEVSEHDVPVGGLPASLDGFGVAQITDAHLTGIGTVERAVVSAVRAHDVQLVVLTGDIVDSVRRLGVLSALLSELQPSRAALIGSLGNWEHWGAIPPEDLSRTYRDVGARLLVNESFALSQGVEIFATDDSTGGQARFAMAPHRFGWARLLVTHSPELLDRFPEPAGKMALSLAGHTHGGQVRLGPGLVPFVPRGSGRFVAGWYDTPAGRAYVSRGTGTSILPVRFTCRPELPIFRLRRG
jgi:predicted MPP superfamily phosphohydrolase